MWDDLESLFLNHQVLKVDFLGHGNSKGSALESYGMDDLALLLQEILHHNNINNPIVLGHSMGGYVGLELLKIDTPKSLILLNSNFWADSESKKINRNRVIEVVQKNKGLFLNEALRNLFFIDNEEVNLVQDRLILEARNIQVEDIIKTTIGLRDRQDCNKVVQDFHSKIMILQAENDPIIPMEEMRNQIHQLIKKPEFFLIKNSGHMSVWGNLKATKSILKKLI